MQIHKNASLIAAICRVQRRRLRVSIDRVMKMAMIEAAVKYVADAAFGGSDEYE